MNLFSLVFALLAALAVIVLLMLIFAAVEREKAPQSAPADPTRAVLVERPALRS